MSTSPAFEWTATRMEGLFGLSRLEARGTLRHLLKDAGLEPETVQPAHLEVALTRLLPKLLKSRGVPNSEPACASLARDLTEAKLEGGDSKAAPESVFKRLGRW